MTLQQLRCFVIVCRLRSFTKAAEVLYVSQPAVSKSITELEKEWRLQLFDRSQSPLEITPAGQFALTNARTILQQAERFSNAMARMGNHETNLSIVMNSQVSLLIYPNLITQFEAENPDIHVRLVEVREHADQRIKNDPASDIIFMPNIGHRFDKDTFVCKKLFESEYVIIAGKGTYVASLSGVTPDVVADLPVIADYCPRDLYADHFVPVRLASFLHGKSIQVISSQISVCENLVRNGQAYSFMLRESAKRMHNITVVPLSPAWTQDIFVCYPKNKNDYPTIKRFMSFLESYDYRQL